MRRNEKSEPMEVWAAAIKADMEKAIVAGTQAATLAASAVSGLDESLKAAAFSVAAFGKQLAQVQTPLTAKPYLVDRLWPTELTVALALAFGAEPPNVLASFVTTGITADGQWMPLGNKRWAQLRRFALPWRSQVRGRGASCA